MVSTPERPAAESAAEAVDADLGLSTSRALADLREPLLLRLPPQWQLTDDMLFEFAEANGDGISMERTADGDVIITGAPHGRSPSIGMTIGRRLGNWLEAQGIDGDLLDSSGGFNFGPPPPPDQPQKRPQYQPDVSWVPQAAIDALDPEVYHRGVMNLCPPFLVEIISAKQRVAPQQRKMEMYLANGMQLGWLIDPEREKVWIYRAGQQGPEELERPLQLSGEDLFVGFVLNCRFFWR